MIKITILKSFLQSPIQLPMKLLISKTEVNRKNM